jgi:ubiquitin-like protein Pup
MAKQEKKREKKKDDKREDQAAANPEVVEKGKKIKEDLDKLMDEIDDVLEQNAEEFVKNYVQKGGQ